MARRSVRKAKRAITEETVEIAKMIEESSISGEKPGHSTPHAECGRSLSMEPRSGKTTGFKNQYFDKTRKPCGFFSKRRRSATNWQPS